MDADIEALCKRLRTGDRMRTPYAHAAADAIERLQSLLNIVEINHETLGVIHEGAEEYIKTLSARLAEAEARLREAEGLLRKDAETFRHYGTLHREKGTHDGLRKAEVNETYAARIDAFLAGRTETGMTIAQTEGHSEIAGFDVGKFAPRSPEGGVLRDPATYWTTYKADGGDR